MNFFNKKNQQRVAILICTLLIVAMVIPMVLGSLG